MGRHSHNSHSGIPIQSSHPGCIWGILHVLKYHGWRYIKRCPPTKRTSKHAVGNDSSIPEVDGALEHDHVRNDSHVVDNKMTPSTPTKVTPTKVSVKSRLKARISDELSKRKGQHRRSSTYPIRSHLVRTDSIHHLELSDEDPLTVMEFNDASLEVADNKNSSITSTLDPLLPKSFEEQSCEEEYGVALNKDLDKVVDDNWLNLIRVKQLTRDASAYKSKEILDALEMMNMNKEFFLKILQDPGSPLLQHFHNQQAFSAKRKVNRSLSFPVPALSYKGGSHLSELKHKEEVIESHVKEEKLQGGSQTPKSIEPKSRDYIRSQSMPTIAAEYRADGILKLNQTIAESFNNSPSTEAYNLKSRGPNNVVIKRFKDLKHKIEHAIKETKKEKHRIAMDGILHKIPSGHGFYKDLIEDIVDHWKKHSKIRDDKESPTNSNESDNSFPSTSKSEAHTVSRTSSFSESLDKYCQLYKSTLNREVKHYHETPELRTEDAALPSMSASNSFVKNVDDGSTSMTCNFSQDNQGHPSTSENYSQLDAKSDILDNMGSEIYSAGDKSEIALVANIHPDVVDFDRETRDSASNNERIQHLSEYISELVEHSVIVPEPRLQVDAVGSASFPISEDQSLRHVPPDKLDSLEDHQLAELNMNTATMVEDEDENSEYADNNLSNDIVLIQVNDKEKAEFDYVRYVLDLSGFSLNELPEKWYSENEAIDPSVFEEVEGCMLLDPNCSGNEEGDHCHHPLLFDLINEVLVEVCARSYTYYPIPLTPLSHIRPMPVRHCVLEEVWANMSWYFSSKPKAEQLLDHTVSRDLAKNNGWMNLQFDSECVGLELEELIFDDLLDGSLLLLSLHA